MCMQGKHSFFSTCLNHLKCSTNLKSLAEGKQAHAQLLKSTLRPNILLDNTLINMYAKCGSIYDARQVFDMMYARNVYTWTTIVAAYASHGNGREALNIFVQMESEEVKPDKVTFVNIVSACSTIEVLERGKIIHASIIKSEYGLETSIGNTLIVLYAKCSSIHVACIIFDRMMNRDAVSWNSLIAGYAQQRDDVEPFKLYSQMKEEDVKPNRITFLTVLGACISNMGTLQHVKELHAGILKSECKSDSYLGSSLIDVYAKRGCIEDACQVFSRLTAQDVVSWNTIIAGYAQHDNGKKAITLFHKMQCIGIEPNQVTFISTVGACANIPAYGQGKHLHAQILKCKFEGDIMMNNTLIDMYIKCRSIKDAVEVFIRIKVQDVVSWNAMIAYYSQEGDGKQAFHMFRKMQQEGQKPDKVTFLHVLSACTSDISAIEQGKHLHEEALKAGYDSDVSVSSTLVDMYAKCGCIDDAQQVFDRMHVRNVVTWNAVIAGHAHLGDDAEALRLYKRMKRDGVKPNDISFATVLSACSVFVQGKNIHADILNADCASDIFIGNTLVDMYAKYGSIEDACRMFDNIPERNAVTWSIIVGGFVRHGFHKQAFHLLRQMQSDGFKPSEATFLSVLSASADSSALEQGKYNHCCILKIGYEQDIFIGNTLLDMYAKCGSLDEAYLHFHRMPVRDVISWNAMLNDHALNRKAEAAIEALDQMHGEHVMPNNVTFVGVLKACSLTNKELGKWVHANVLKFGYGCDIFVGNALVDMYSKRGCLGAAHEVFNRIYICDCATWNAMILGYVQAGYCCEAFDLFRVMNAKANEITFIAILCACTQMAALEKGRQVHADILEAGYEIDVFLGSTIVDMYAKAGSMRDAEEVFSKLPKRVLVLWNALIAAFAQHGQGKDALDSFVQMQQENVKPTDITFVSVLSACRHGCFVNEGCHWFGVLSKEYDIPPTLNHYACITDLLGRAGYIDEAEQLTNQMPFESGILIWMSLLGACRTHDDVEIAERSLQHIIELEPWNTAAFELLASIYAAQEKDGVECLDFH